jgi:hypothetical protein
MVYHRCCREPQNKNKKGDCEKFNPRMWTRSCLRSVQKFRIGPRGRRRRRRRRRERERSFFGCYLLYCRRPRQRLDYCRYRRPKTGSAGRHAKSVAARPLHIPVGPRFLDQHAKNPKHVADRSEPDDDGKPQPKKAIR